MAERELTIDSYATKERWAEATREDPRLPAAWRPEYAGRTYRDIAEGIERQSASTIDALQAENERLRTNCDAYANHVDHWQGVARRYQARVTLLEVLLEASVEAKNVLTLIVSMSHDKAHARGTEWVSREELIGEGIVFWLDRIKAAQATLFQAHHALLNPVDAALSRSDPLSIDNSADVLAATARVAETLTPAERDALSRSDADG